MMDDTEARETTPLITGEKVDPKDSLQKSMDEFRAGGDPGTELLLAHGVLKNIVDLCDRNALGTANWRIFRKAEAEQEYVYHHVKHKTENVGPLKLIEWNSLLYAYRVAIASLSHEFALRAMHLLLEILALYKSGNTTVLGHDLLNHLREGKDKYTKWPTYALKLQTFHEFYDASTCIPSLSYAATSESAISTAGVDNVRFATAWYLNSDQDKVKYLPQHLRVHVVKDHNAVARAFVCIAYSPVLKTDEKKPHEFGGAYDVMFYPNALPQETHFWRAENVIIIFTGTESNMVWLGTNFKAWKYPLNSKEHGLDGNTHHGFGEMMEGMWPQIQQGLRDPHNRNQNPYEYLRFAIERETTVWILGHSLGGALATLCAARVHALMKERRGGDFPDVYTPPVWLSTIAAPPCLDREAKECYDDLPIVVKRVFIEGDVVVMPFGVLGFEHIGWNSVICRVRHVDEQASSQGMEDGGDVESRKGWTGWLCWIFWVPLNFAMLSLTKIFGAAVSFLVWLILSFLPFSWSALDCHMAPTYRSTVLRHFRKQWVLSDVIPKKDEDDAQCIRSVQHKIETAREMFPARKDLHYTTSKELWGAIQKRWDTESRAVKWAVVLSLMDLSLHILLLLALFVWVLLCFG